MYRHVKNLMGGLMARPRAFDEHEVLNKAADVFARHGFDGTTMALLSEAMALSPPSIYAAFGSKRGLFDAVLDHYSDSQSTYGSWIMSAPTAREVSERMLFGAVEALSAPDHAPGCLLIQAGLSAAPENADVPVELARRRQLAEVALHERFEQAKIAGDLAADVDTAALASFVTAVFGGLSIKAAGGATREELRAIAEQAMDWWQRRSAVATTGSQPTSSTRSVADLDSPPGGRGRPREFCARDALDAAMEVYWRKGYEGASLSDLTEAMKITRPTLYSTFGNKETLFRRALDRYETEHLAYVSDALKAPTLRDVVEGLLNGALAAAVSEGHPAGCLMVMNAMQGGDEAANIRAEVLSRLNIGRDHVLARFERARDDGEIPAPYEPDGLVRLLSSIIQGLALQSSIGASADELRTLVDTALAMWPTR